jgi:hypothetical protein
MNTRDTETLIAYGGEVKALGDGKIGGYLVRFTEPGDNDLDEEFFTKETDFGDPKPVPLTGTVYFHHGADKKLGKRRLGTATHKVDEFGVWVETQLELRDKYEKFIYQRAKQKKMGWSSGTASHLIEREVTAKGTWIKSWPIGLDDTITPTPAEPRNGVIALKSWEPDDIDVDLSGLVDSIDKPLSGTKRKELNELLELCSGLDAVRSDIAEVLAAEPQPKLVASKLIGYQMAEKRKKLQAMQILKE